MALLQIRDFPDDVYQLLKIRAEHDHRTIGAEITHILTEIVKDNNELILRKEAIQRIKSRRIPTLSVDPVDMVREDRDR
jgi:plasmid stability protein